MRRLGIIGAGGMTETLLDAVTRGLPAPLEAVTILATRRSAGKAEALLARHGDALAAARLVRTERAAFLADAPQFVAECAGQGAVREHGVAVLETGAELAVISIGALADEALRLGLEQAAARAGARLVLPPGAVGGIDALVAARLSRLEEVTYTGRKPPLAWKGTPAEALLDLATLAEPAIFFDGTAREAAIRYPQNANVAATVALAGAGFEATRVRLVADPTINRNLHEVAVRSAAADFTIRLEGRPSPTNPKTSLTAGLSMAREVLNRVLPLVV
ncbi:aspartate dehydrogenase [Roseomonas marmotae]|uniref:L-aspartate dehydrogenase n=1 Tax=Roseomonas marmotae TaxID=2768161 RepID=A0ABS3K739_9PROT|nr:aspartate dehydrogenase [Roseomonas marmotae]QTI81030.1 aspartate dehydrogenase [Roseomonas marmotae]